mgnify:CR=1 FL=1
MKRAIETRIDGTYPYDDGGEWEKVKQLTLEEAASLTKLSAADYTPASFGNTYMWLNKGYIKVSAAQAVYLHDGKYSLIQKKGWECRSSS